MCEHQWRTTKTKPAELPHFIWVRASIPKPNLLSCGTGAHTIRIECNQLMIGRHRCLYIVHCSICFFSLCLSLSLVVVISFTFGPGSQCDFLRRAVREALNAFCRCWCFSLRTQLFIQKRNVHFNFLSANCWILHIFILYDSYYFSFSVVSLCMHI